MSPLPLMTRFAMGGMISSVDYLASEAGLGLLKSGGSAADAAVAASAVLAVTTPHMCGMGGDLFALVKNADTADTADTVDTANLADSAGPADRADSRDTKPEALNASGRAGSGADPGRLRAEGNRLMPFSGDLRSAPVPGCVDGWLALHARHGRSRWLKCWSRRSGTPKTGSRRRHCWREPCGY